MSSNLGRIQISTKSEALLELVILKRSVGFHLASSRQVKDAPLVFKLNLHIIRFHTRHINSKPELFVVLGDLVARRREAHRISLEGGKTWRDAEEH